MREGSFSWHAQGHWSLGSTDVLPLCYLIWAWKYGKEAGPNQWLVGGELSPLPLEWQKCTTTYVLSGLSSFEKRMSR